jgi:hypothetical protein
VNGEVPDGSSAYLQVGNLSPNPNGKLRAALKGRWRETDRCPQPCLDCGWDTQNEYFIVHHDLWHQAVRRRYGFLCVPCLEHRIGRRLTPADFLPCGANDLDWRKSDRLRERMTE